MIIGIDFDNTIVCYDNSFMKIIEEDVDIPDDLAPVKDEVRNFLRKQGKENKWIEMQGFVYGPGILDAEPFPGVKNFLLHCKKNGIKACIISHKTLNPFMGKKYNLHEYAKKWLEKNGFYDKDGTGLAKNDVFFELTKEEKLNRIMEQKCTHYIDDLPEFLSEKKFPGKVKKILFDPNGRYRENKFEAVNSWKGMITRLK
jgi:hypothetical protein